MTENDLTLYKWLDAEEMRPKRVDSDSQRAANKMLFKVFESLISDAL